MKKKKWLEKVANRFVKVSHISRTLAKDFAWISYQEIYDEFPDCPEYAADEEMSCWDDDGGYCSY